MAKSTIRATVVLELPADEARWLRALLQNPIRTDEHSEPLEDPRDARFRESIFSALPSDATLRNYDA